MDYLCFRVSDVGHELHSSGDPLRAMFGKHLLAVADALHDIEWVDSGDTLPGDEHAAIRKVLGLEVSVVAVIAGRLRQMADALEWFHPHERVVLVQHVQLER